MSILPSTAAGKGSKASRVDQQESILEDLEALQDLYQPPSPEGGAENRTGDTGKGLTRV